MQYRIRNGDNLVATVTESQYHLNGLTPNTDFNISVTPFNGSTEGKSASITVKTRGIHISVPTQLPAASTQTLTYEEYSLGLVPIGKEPAGMFGGGHKQEVPAKVVSSDSTSVLEITNSFNLMPDNITMKQIADGSFAAYDGYKALFLK